MQRIEEMQLFWTTHADASAILGVHPLLRHVPREPLLATIRTGCGFHRIWERRRIGELRDVIDRLRSTETELTASVAELESAGGKMLEG